MRIKTSALLKDSETLNVTTTSLSDKSPSLDESYGVQSSSAINIELVEIIRLVDEIIAKVRRSN